MNGGNNNNDGKCRLCGQVEDYDREIHNDSEKHRFNYFLMEYNIRRKKVVQNRNHIEVKQWLNLENRNNIKEKFNASRGALVIEMLPEQFTAQNRTLRFIFEVKNNGKKPMVAIVKVLHPYVAFQLESNQNTYPLLEEGSSYRATVKFQLNHDMIGSIKIPVGITLQPENKDDAKNYFTIYREVVIYIKSYEKQDKIKNSPFKKDFWTGVTFIGPSSAPIVSNNFPIPVEYLRIFMTGLTPLTYFTYTETQDILRIKRILDQGPTRENFEEYFHYLLWLDEVGAKLGLQMYNMTNIYMTLVRGRYLELEVPGLGEKRPSILSGDLVNIRTHSDHTAYQGVVDTITDKTIFIKNVHDELLHVVREESLTELDVSFDFSRLQHERMHMGVQMIVRNLLLDVIFPYRPLRTIVPTALTRNRLFNKSIFQNNEQLIAVQNIVSQTSQFAPYIVYGPPGTGKTVTIVEAILQIKHYTNKHILICAPANAACDMLTEKLIEHCETSELLRIHSANRTLADIPSNIKRYSNLEGEDFIKYQGQELAKKFRIVIATLHLIGKFSGFYSPDCVFIDEAAQATIPECAIPISLLRPGKQVILAGDPKQLGPVLSSIIAGKKGLATSLLEMLMDKNTLYQPTQQRPLEYDPNFLTMLVRNYRSPEEILKIPNKLFYGDSLISINHEDYISKTFISNYVMGTKANNVKLGVPIEFCGLISKEERNGYSPSYYNDAEVEMVMKYIKAMLALNNIKVTGDDIGVIAPYIRQVHRIKEELKKIGEPDIQVGTTESFQGREKRIMIITTVRAQHSLLRYDNKYNLGFVDHPRRFNVAITRAKSKLIIVGNPFVLCTDKMCWFEYIEYCRELGAYFGVPFEERTSLQRTQILNRLNGI